MLKNIFFDKWFPHWSPDIALRYLPIVKEIKKEHSGATILDVGSGSLGITPYLNKQVTGVDLLFLGPKSKLLKPVKIKGVMLPFRNNSFDYVVCVDVLEHVTAHKRNVFIHQLLRVARKKVFLVFPTSAQAESEDRWMQNYITRKYGKPDPYLEEHIQYGLPDLQTVLNQISNKHKIEVKSNINIYLHRIILIVQFSKSKLGRFTSSVIFVLLIPFFSKINLEPTYRKLIIVHKSKSTK